MKKIKKVTVYCASSDKLATKYFAAAQRIGEILVNHDITVIYGGGAKGLMGKLADTVIKNKGTIIGVMPEFMQKVEWQHNGISELILTKDMHERKKKFMEDTDALIALPGGCGTLEELLEAITLKKLGVFINPIIILNQDGYYDPLIAMLETCIFEKFMSVEHRGIWTVIREPEELIDAINNAPEWRHSDIDFAAV
ncbi:MAG: hypothetical protein ACI8P3_003027 [Saprospiraceae bacterium]|jgi:uncharacterized protein (TIGR00730 family)